MMEARPLSTRKRGSDEMNIGLLTGGGDCPGLNAVIRAAIRKGLQFKFKTLGFRRGWAGVIDGDFMPLTLNDASGILARGGTILGTSRTNPFKLEGGVERIVENIEKFNIGALVAIGGEDTLGVAYRLYQEKGVKLVGVPKTIDNDLSATDYTFGFDTAVSIATEAIDRLHSTAESHQRVMVIEVMGRHAGWIALFSGLAGGADCILIPERPFDIDEVCSIIGKRYARGKTFSIIVVAEGANPKGETEVTKDEKVDAFGHIRLGGIGNWLGKEIEKRTNYETRVTILGHTQRGGSPTAFDRILATRFGIKAIELIKEEKFGRMASLQGNLILDVPLSEAVAQPKLVDESWYKLAEVFFG